MKAEVVEREHAREVSRMRRRLDEWRKSNAPGTALPRRLWASAGRLARRHGIHRTARALGLEYNKLKRMSGGEVAAVGAGGRGRAGQRAVKFIEFTGALPLSASGCRLVLQGPGGERLQLEMTASAAAEVVLQLCRCGWGAR